MQPYNQVGTFILSLELQKENYDYKKKDQAVKTHSLRKNCVISHLQSACEGEGNQGNVQNPSSQASTVHELKTPDVQADLEKAEEPGINLPTFVG